MMKFVIFSVLILLYIIYTIFMYRVILPAAKSSIKLASNNNSAYAYVAYTIATLPFIIGCYLLYRSYVMMDSNWFWLIVAIVIIIPLVIAPISMMFIG